MFIVAALYQFVSLENYKEMQKSLKDFCNQHHIKGTLILAAEGINGTVAGTREAIDQLYHYLQKDERFNNLEYKESVAEKMPFYRMKVKVKKEIVTIGIPEVSPTHLNGQYVEAKDWNNLLNDPEVVVLDTRNDYEIKIGTFKNAVNPSTESFTEFPEYVKKNFDPKKHKKVAMFCTGGIRCEKASSYMLTQGFENVYHLKGGILKYLETVSADQSLWEGECFVFDQRIAVKHNLEQGTHECCYACRLPLSEADRQSPMYKKGISCPYCYDLIPTERKKAFANRQKQVDIASSRQQQHIGLSRAEAKKQKMLLGN